MGRANAVIAAMVVVLAQTLPAGAQEPTEPDARTVEARESYSRGVALVKSAQWAEALAMFERSAQTRPHPTTFFNIGACERALGRYARAQSSFRRALTEGESSGALPPSLVTEAKGYVEEIERLLARVEVTLEPREAGVAVDGRPLEAGPASSSGPPVLVAGALPPGPGAAPPAAVFQVVLDPGAHVFTLSRKGYSDAVVNRTFAPGSRSQLRLELSRLPATLHVSSNVSGALVTVDEADVGPVPVDVLRPAGAYTVRVRKEGFAPYEAKVAVNAGEAANLQAGLSAEKVPLTKKWWFWTGIGAVVVGGAALTYVLTRPNPAPPPYDGGSTGWVVQPTGMRF